MARKIYAKRAAQAVFNIALERKELDRWQSDLKKMAGIGEDATLLSLLQNPRLHFDSKAKLLAERFADANPLALNLLYLLLTRGRLKMIGDIAAGYERLLNSYRGIELAEVTTAVPLDEEYKQKLAERLGAVVGKKVVVRPEVNPELIGGIIARVGDRLLDGSTRSKLAALRAGIAGTRQ